MEHLELRKSFSKVPESHHEKGDVFVLQNWIIEQTIDRFTFYNIYHSMKSAILFFLNSRQFLVSLSYSSSFFFLSLLQYVRDSRIYRWRPQPNVQASGIYLVLVKVTGPDKGVGQSHPISPLSIHFLFLYPYPWNVQALPRYHTTSLTYEEKLSEPWLSHQPNHSLYDVKEKKKRKRQTKGGKKDTMD